MIKRFAFASLAVMGLAGPAFAFDAQPGGDASATSDDGIAGSDNAGAPKRIRRVAKAKVVAVLPPQRPEQAGPDIAAASISDVPASVDARPASALADAVEDAKVGGKVVAVLPPLRPSMAPAASALADIDQTEPVTAQAAPEPETSPARPGGKAVAALPPSRPAFPGDEAPVEMAALTTEPVASVPASAVEPASPVAPETGLFGSIFGSFPQTPNLDSSAVTISSGRAGLDALIATHAKLNGVPADLVHRVVIRESKYNPRAVGSGGAMGLMQIKTGTARALGYGGNAAGLLDAETNLTYAVKYLAGAYRTANGDYARAISYYARGYYYAQKRNGSIREASNRGRHRDRDRDRVRQEADATPPGVTWNTAAIASESSSRVP